MSMAQTPPSKRCRRPTAGRRPALQPLTVTCWISRHRTSRGRGSRCARCSRRMATGGAYICSCFCASRSLDVSSVQRVLHVRTLAEDAAQRVAHSRRVRPPDRRPQMHPLAQRHGLHGITLHERHGVHVAGVVLGGCVASRGQRSWPDRVSGSGPRLLGTGLRGQSAQYLRRLPRRGRTRRHGVGQSHGAGGAAV